MNWPFSGVVSIWDSRNWKLDFKLGAKKIDSTWEAMAFEIGRTIQGTIVPLSSVCAVRNGAFDFMCGTYGQTPES